MANGRDAHKKNGRKKPGVDKAKNASPFDFVTGFAAAVAKIGVPAEELLIKELLEVVARRKGQDVGPLSAAGPHQVDVELVAAAAQTASEFSLKRKLVESPVAAATTVAAYNFDHTETRSETVLAALIHRFSDKSDAFKLRTLTRLKINRKKGSARNPEVQAEIDRQRADAFDTAISIAKDAAKITLTPRDFAVRDGGASAEDFTNLREALLSFRPEVAIVKVADAASGLDRIDRAPYHEQEARLALIEGAYIPLADALGWSRLANRMRDDVLYQAKPTLVDALKKAIEDLPGYAGLYSDPQVHKQLTVDLPQRIKGDLVRNAIYEANQILVTGRRKSLHGVAKKLTDKKYNSLEQMPDILALRIVIPDGRDRKEDHDNCMKIMGALKKIGLKQISGSFTDHISNPDKPYESLHSLFLYGGMKVEIQVRTVRMHWDAELRSGVSHLDYAEGNKDKSGNAALHADSYLQRVEQVRAYIGPRLQGTGAPPAQPAANIFCVDEDDGRMTKMPGNGPSIMDALINMHRKPKDGITAADAAHASHVFFNGKRLDMDERATRKIEIENGDLLRIDLAGFDKGRRIEPKWKVATRYARDILLQELRAQDDAATIITRTPSAAPPDRVVLLGKKPTRQPR